MCIHVSSQTGLWFSIQPLTIPFKYLYRDFYVFFFFIPASHNMFTSCISKAHWELPDLQAYELISFSFANTSFSPSIAQRASRYDKNLIGWKRKFEWNRRWNLKPVMTVYCVGGTCKWRQFCFCHSLTLNWVFCSPLPDFSLIL